MYSLSLPGRPQDVLITLGIANVEKHALSQPIRASQLQYGARLQYGELRNNVYPISLYIQDLDRFFHMLELREYTITSYSITTLLI